MKYLINIYEIFDKSYMTYIRYYMGSYWNWMILFLIAHKTENKILSNKKHSVILFIYELKTIWYIFIL